MSTFKVGYECLGCERVVEVTDANPPRYVKHGLNSMSRFTCSNSGRVVPLSLRQPPTSRHGDGAKGTAPCGHEGTYVSARMVLCDRDWCDGLAPRRQRVTEPVPLNSCVHAVKRTYFNGTTVCRQCGQILSKGKP
jgi:hypothetical protein